MYFSNNRKITFFVNLSRYAHRTNAAQPLKHASPRRDDESLPVGLVHEQLAVRRLRLHLLGDRLLDQLQLVSDVILGPDAPERFLGLIPPVFLHQIVRALGHHQEQHREHGREEQAQHVELSVIEHLSDRLHAQHAHRQHDRENGQHGTPQLDLGYFAHVYRYGAERHPLGQSGEQPGRVQHVQPGRPHENRDPGDHVQRSDDADRQLPAE